MIGESEERAMAFAQTGHFMKVEIFGLGGVFAHAVKENDLGTTVVTKFLQGPFDFFTSRDAHAG